MAVKIIFTIIFCLVPFIKEKAFANSSISFDDALNKVINNDFSLRLSKNNLERTDARKDGAYAQFLPEISVSASENRDATFSKSGKRVAGSMELNLWKNGADVFGLKSQDNFFKAAESEFNFENFKAETRATLFIFDYLWKLQTVKIKNSQVETRKELVAIAKSRYQMGLIPENQVLSAEVDLENSQSSLIFAQQDLQDVKAELERSLGTLGQNIDIESGWPYEEILKSDTIKNLLTIPAHKESRPDYQKKFFALEASDLSLSKARSEFFPTVDLSAQRSKIELYGANQYETSFALTVTMPIFERLNDYVNYKETQFRLFQQKYEMMEFDQKFEADYRAKQKILERGLERQVARQDILKKGEKLFLVMKTHYSAGKLSYQDLALAQDRYFNSLLNYAQGQRELHNALVDYCHAQGKSIKKCF